MCWARVLLWARASALLVSRALRFRQPGPRCTLRVQRCAQLGILCFERFAALLQSWRRLWIGIGRRLRCRVARSARRRLFVQRLWSVHPIAHVVVTCVAARMALATFDRPTAAVQVAFEWPIGERHHHKRVPTRTRAQHVTGNRKVLRPSHGAKRDNVMVYAAGCRTADTAGRSRLLRPSVEGCETSTVS